MNKLPDIPWQYDFPPFFTLQPNENTRLKQLQSWCELVLNYCKHNRIFRLNIIDYQSSELFQNKKIDRKLSIEFIQQIIEELKKSCRAEWVIETPSKKQQIQTNNCIILWNTLDEWAKLIYDEVNNRGLQNTVCTYYELIESDEYSKSVIFKLDTLIMRKALGILQKQGKAEIIKLDEYNEGVKFF